MGKGNLTADQKDSIAHFLLAHSTKGVPFKGKISEAATKWSVSRKTIWLWWNRAKEKILEEKPIHLPSRMLGNTNSPKVNIDIEMIKSLPFKNRSSISKIAKKLKVGHGTVQRWVEKGELKRHSNPIHPSLTDSNKLQRLLFSLESISVDIAKNLIKFKDMSCQVHIDEKWFYLTTTTDTYYIVPGEEEPHRSCQSKRYITKVMFMCAVSRPVYGEDAIKAKWPANASKNIYIQQDNARPHISDLDPDFRAAASSDGFNIHLIFQPPNSPDLNINDLGFFRSLQTLQNDEVASTVDELVGNVMTAFIDHDSMKLNFNYLTLQSVMVEIMKCRGHNNFKIPHMRKESLLRHGLLPVNLTVDVTLVKECLDYLDQNGFGSSLTVLREGVAQLFTIEVENLPGEVEMLQMIEAAEVNEVGDLFWFDCYAC
ncbi:uncharacterized protein LOC141627901 [Silene latifolia]|uniref:uncharacterized protein LOC141627901 n=1 Tax=Silene latifolia TaxID=37657 RepID=UPI003D770513